MLTTLELRWFISDSVPSVVEHWFHTRCPGQLQGGPEERQDFYLYLPNCDYLNVKFRQGNLEVKWRSLALGMFVFGEVWEGTVEHWLKWICAAPDLRQVAPEELTHGPWVGVNKGRSQRLYQGIALELTKLKIGGETWWSIACEMADANAHSVEHFVSVIREVSATYQGPELASDRSQAYPSWLSMARH